MKKSFPLCLLAASNPTPVTDAKLPAHPRCFVFVCTVITIQIVLHKLKNDFVLNETQTSPFRIFSGKEINKFLNSQIGLK
jgi:hypothetical protein